MPDRHSQRHSLPISHRHRLNLLPCSQSRQSRLLDYPYQSPLYMAPGPDPAYGTVERAKGANEGPERSQARTKQRKPSQKVIVVCLQHERLSTEVSRDTSRDMAGEVGRNPLLHVPPSKHGDFHVACKT